MKLTLSINRCPIHQDFWSISIDSEDGTGKRLTSGKCCGQWRQIKAFPLDEEGIDSVIKDLEQAKWDALGDEECVDPTGEIAASSRTYD